METYLVESNHVSLVIRAKTTRDAFRQFFQRVVKTQEWRELGQIALIRGKGGNDIAARVATALCLLGTIEKETALLNVQNTVGSSFQMKDLDCLLEQDSWVLSRMETAGSQANPTSEVKKE